MDAAEESYFEIGGLQRVRFCGQHSALPGDLSAWARSLDSNKEHTLDISPSLSMRLRSVETLAGILLSISLSSCPARAQRPPELTSPALWTVAHALQKEIPLSPAADY